MKERAGSGGRMAVVHSIHHPVSAAAFILPLVRGLREHGVRAEVWVEPMALAHPALADPGAPLVGATIDLALRPGLARGLISLVREFRRRQVGVVHAHQSRAALLPLLAARLAGVTERIYHNHGLPYVGHHGLMRLALRLLERANIGLATRVLMVSPSLRAIAVADGLIAPERAEVIGAGSIAGIDLARFRPPTADEARAARARWGVAASSLVVGWVGRPLARKGYGRMLAAWERARLATRGAALLLAGASADPGVAGARALGHVTEMPSFYHACDVVALLSDHEGIPYALLEGGACGRALLGSDIPGIRDLVAHERTGLLCPPEPAAAAAALLTLADDAGLRARLGCAARAQAEAKFDRASAVAALAAWYRLRLGLGDG
jgi:N,N'-diacetylbacillosaminyl-diphospho-undecaprenol alpha-1,3-N-acetylgalactosaminyltransferase